MPCPLHNDSHGEIEDGDLHNIQCRSCGDYRISDVALTQLRNQGKPRGWEGLVALRRLISSRDMRALYQT